MAAPSNATEALLEVQVSDQITLIDRELLLLTKCRAKLDERLALIKREEERMAALDKELAAREKELLAQTDSTSMSEP